MLDEDRNLATRVKAFDRALRSIAFGSCAPWPVLATAQLLRVQFPNLTISTEVIASDDTLLAGLRDRTYHLVALHEMPESRDVFCQYLVDENMTISVKKDHRLAKRSSIIFDDLEGESIFAWGNVSFWNDMIRAHLAGKANLLFQTDFDALDELITKTDFPAFSSDRMAEGGYVQEDRVDIPLDDPDAHASYYVACLDAEKERYSSFFNALRAQAITGGK